MTLDGFSTPSIRVMDITDPRAILEVPGTVHATAGLYAIAIETPAGDERRLLAFTELTVARPARVQANRPSSWQAAANAFDYLVLARREFLDALQPLVALRARQGYHGAVVDIEDVYDEFSFGEKTPAAIKAFLARATTTWQRNRASWCSPGMRRWTPATTRASATSI